MRFTRALIPTLREIPKEAEAQSHRLMLKAGFIRKLSSGIYSYLPLGLRVLERVCAIIREEMNQAGALELLLPALHPAELWKKSGRYDALGQDKIAFKNRSDQEFVLGPTHEEVITELAGAYLKSYSDLPRTFYQIQTKFRDEVRPRFGIIRTKEFIMKDAYSFDRDEAGLNRSYQAMYETYQRILTRAGLAFDIVAADPGIMGGNVSHEFMVRSEYGEDRIVICPACHYLASRDIASRRLPKASPRASSKAIEAFDTPGLRTIAEISSRFAVKPAEMVKTILYVSDQAQVIAACVRGDHEVHEGKLRKLLGTQSLRLATPEEIQKASSAPIGFTGPVGLKNIRIVVDGDIPVMADFVTGANQKDRHYRNVHYGRDFQADHIADIRYAQEGDLCVQCGKPLEFSTAMEVGHVFKLGTRYTKTFEAFYRSEAGETLPVIMGCYGIGVNRMVAAIVEQHHDAKGISWPVSVAPYSTHLITINQSDPATQRAAEEIYEELNSIGRGCLFDDRDERAGVKFNDADLIGIPIQVIIGERNLAKNQVEIKIRSNLQSRLIPRPELKAVIGSLICG